MFVGPLDVHPSQDAIVVHYEVEAIVLNEYGEPAVADRKSAQKVYVVPLAHLRRSLGCNIDCSYIACPSVRQRLSLKYNVRPWIPCKQIQQNLDYKSVW